MKTHQDRSGAVPLVGTLAQHHHHLEELSTMWWTMPIYVKYYYVHLFYRICYFQHTTLAFNTNINTFSSHLKTTKSNTNTVPIQLIKLRRYHFAGIWFSTLS
jgi:hypothetical protein